jgi:hypothetical protein
MTAVHADPDVSLSEHLANLEYERCLQSCLGTLSRPGWQKRLTPLAEHMARQRLVRARGYAGAVQRHLDQRCCARPSAGCCVTNGRMVT